MAVIEWFEGFDGFLVDSTYKILTGTSDRGDASSIYHKTVVKSINRPGNRICFPSGPQYMPFSAPDLQSDFWMGASVEGAGAGEVELYLRTSESIYFSLYYHMTVGTLRVVYNPSGSANDVTETIGYIAPLCEHMLEIGWLASQNKIQIWADNILVAEYTGLTLPTAYPDSIKSTQANTYADNMYVSAQRRGDIQVAVLTLDTPTTDILPAIEHVPNSVFASGNRMGIIDMYSDIAINDRYIYLLDGNTVSSSMWFTNHTYNTAGKAMYFTFPYPISVRGFTWYQTTPSAGVCGVFSWDWSLDDGVTWVNDGTTFNLGNTTTAVTEYTIGIDPPLTRKYRLCIASGITAAPSRITAIEFRVYQPTATTLQLISEPSYKEFIRGSGDLLELPTTNTIPADADIIGVRVIHRARKTSTGNVEANLILGTTTDNVVDVIRPPIGLAGKGQVLLNDPATSLPWTKADLDSLEVRIEESTP